MPHDGIRGGRLTSLLSKFVRECRRRKLLAASAGIVLFESAVTEFNRDALRRRFDNMIGSNNEIVAWADEEWALNSDKLSKLLVEFGLVAIKSGSRTVLPYESDFIGMSKQSDTILTYLPGMVPKIKFSGGSASQSPWHIYLYPAV